MSKRTLPARLSLLLLLVGPTSTVQAESVRVAWNPTPEPNVAGYLLHYGPRPGTYIGTIDAGNALWSRVENLAERETYYLAVEAYDADGNKSPFSNELEITTGGTGPPRLTYYLAEGATGDFFDLDVSLANPNTVPAPVTLRFLREDGSVVERTDTLAPLSHRTLRVNDLPELRSGAVSTVVQSDDALPLLVERSMFWPSHQPRAGHGEAALTGPSQNWYFAEGYQGYFDTFVLLANANKAPATVNVSFLRETGGPVRRTYTVAAESRLTIWTGSINELAGRAFSTIIDSDRPVIAERAMYFGPTWAGGHESAGVTAPATSWYHAEGATGDFFDTFILVANPGTKNTRVTFTYLLDSGVTITKSRQVRANSRVTVDIRSEDRRLRDTAVSTIVTSDMPIISERSMYWPGGGREWLEGHNSFGVSQSAPRWGLAGGRVGGDLKYETFLLLANPNASAVPVRITFLRNSGATVTKEYTVTPTSRMNVHVNSMVPELSDETFGAIVESTTGAPIVLERAIYFAGWRGGTNAVGSILPLR